jgi:hypothetical protein
MTWEISLKERGNVTTMDKVDYITLLSFKTREVMTYLLAISIYTSDDENKEELVLFKRHQGSYKISLMEVSLMDSVKKSYSYNI